MVISVEEHRDQGFQPGDSPPLTLTESQLSAGAALENMRPLFSRGYCQTGALTDKRSFKATDTGFCSPATETLNVQNTVNKQWIFVTNII